MENLLRCNHNELGSDSHTRRIVRLITQRDGRNYNMIDRQGVTRDLANFKPRNRPGLQTLSSMMSLRGFWTLFGVILLWGVVSRLALDAHSYFDAEDALYYSVNIRGLKFSLYDAAGSGWQLLCTAIDALLPVSSEATAAGKLVARVAGTLLLPLLYITLVMTTGRVALSAAMTLFFSGAFCPWWYSLQPDKYVPQLLVIAVALAMVMTRKRPPSAAFLITLGLVYFLAVIVHTDSGLICLSIMPLLFQTMQERGALRAFMQGLLSATVMFVALAVYYAVFLLVFIKPAGAGGALQWMESYLAAPQEMRGWGHWSVGSLLLVFVGIGRSVFATEFAFAFPAFAQYMVKQFPDKILVEEKWFGTHLPPWLLEIGLALLFCAVLAVCAVLVAGVIASRDLLRAGRRKDLYAIACVLCYLVPATIFFTWWEPTNNEFWIAPWYGVVLLLGIAVAGKDWRYTTLGVTASAVILIVCNGMLGVYPRLDAKSDYWQARQGPIARIVHFGDLIVENGFLAANYLEFLGDARVFRVDVFDHTQPALEQGLRHDLDAHPDTKSVYLTDLVTDPTARSKLRGPMPEDGVLERFSKDLPPPAEWIVIDGSRLARYDAPRLHAYLLEKKVLGK